MGALEQIYLNIDTDDEWTPVYLADPSLTNVNLLLFRHRLERFVPFGLFPRLVDTLDEIYLSFKRYTLQ